MLEEPPKTTYSAEHAPPILSYRQRLYERDTLMISNEPWNPKLRMEQMRKNYDRLVVDLGASPRSRSSSTLPVEGVQLPKVPQIRPWQHRQRQSLERAVGAHTDRGPRRVGYDRKVKGAGLESASSTTQAAISAKLLSRVEALGESGQLSAPQARRLRELMALHESLVLSAGTGNDGSVLVAFRSILSYLEEPDAMIVMESDAGEASIGDPHESDAVGASARCATLNEQLAPTSSSSPLPTSRDTRAPQARSPLLSSRKMPSAGAMGRTDANAKAAADAAYTCVDAWVAQSVALAFDLFRSLDAEGDGVIEVGALRDGLASSGLELTEEEVAAFVRKVEAADIASSTSLKALNRMLRPGVSMRRLTRRSEDVAREAGETPLTTSDLVTDGLTEQEALGLKAEAHLRAGRLPSLSPEEEEADGGTTRRKGGCAANEASYVWNSLEARLAPEGVAAAPYWQREALHRTHWQVDVKQRESKRAAKAMHKATNPPIPSWERPTRPSRRHLLERELRQQQVQQAQQAAKVGASVYGGESCAASATGSIAGNLSPPRLGSPQSVRGSEAPEHPTVSSFASVPGAGGGNGTTANPARLAVELADPVDTSVAHKAWLKATGEQHAGTTAQRINRIAIYEQALQQLQLQRQELEHNIEASRHSIDAAQRSGKSTSIDATLRKNVNRLSRLKGGLLEVQNKANAMASSTQALMHVINSLRITRKRHVQRIHGLDMKEKTMDNYSQFLLGSASGAMEERERLRSKHERLKHEAAAWKAMQLKEAAHLGDQLDDLDTETRELEARLDGLDELEKRLDFKAKREASEDAQLRMLKSGYLRGQVAGWAAEFERVTSITGVRFGEGKSDAVDKVLSIYSANELRNKSLFKFVTEDIVLQTETLQAELATEEMRAEHLQAEAAARDVADAQHAAALIDVNEREVVVARQLQTANASVEAVLPVVEKAGALVLEGVAAQLPHHLQGKALAPNAVPEYLALLEDALDELLRRAAGIVVARAPPLIQEVEDGSSPTPRGMAVLVEPEVAPTLRTLRSLTRQRKLASSKNATTLLHSDSSEHLMQHIDNEISPSVQPSQRPVYHGKELLG